jgi:hypothetical protein
MLDNAFVATWKHVQVVTRKERVSGIHALTEAAEASAGQAEGSPADTVSVSNNTATCEEPCQQTDIGRSEAF